MPETVNLGTIAAEVKLGTSQITTARAQLASELGRIGTALDRMASEAEKSGKRTEEAMARALETKKLREFQRELQSSEAARRQFWGDMGKISLFMIGGNASARLLGQGLALVGQEFKNGVNESVALEKALFKLQGRTGATDDQLKEVRKTARALGADLTLPATSSADAAQAISQLAQRGLTLQESMDAAKGTLQLATIAETNAGKAAEFAASSLHMFGLAGTEAARVADIYAASVKASGGSVTEMYDALGNVGPIAANFHLSLETTIGLLTELSRAGLKGAEAGTNLKTMLQRLYSPGDKARATLEGIGVFAYDDEGKARNMGALIRDLTEKLGGLTEARRNEILQTVLGARANIGASIILRQGVKAYDDFQSKVRQTGEAAKQTEARTRGLSGAVDAFMSILRSLEEKESSESGLVGFLTQAVKAGTDLVTTLDTLITRSGELAKQGKDGGIFGWALDQLKELRESLKQVKEQIGRERSFGNGGSEKATTMVADKKDALNLLKAQRFFTPGEASRVDEILRRNGTDPIIANGTLRDFRQEPRRNQLLDLIPQLVGQAAAASKGLKETQVNNSSHFSLAELNNRPVRPVILPDPKKAGSGEGSDNPGAAQPDSSDDAEETQDKQARELAKLEREILESSFKLTRQTLEARKDLFEKMLGKSSSLKALMENERSLRATIGHISQATADQNEAEMIRKGKPEDGDTPEIFQRRKDLADVNYREAEQRRISEAVSAQGDVDEAVLKVRRGLLESYRTDAERQEALRRARFDAGESEKQLQAERLRSSLQFAETVGDSAQIAKASKAIYEQELEVAKSQLAEANRRTSFDASGQLLQRLGSAKSPQDVLSALSLSMATAQVGIAQNHTAYDQSLDGAGTRLQQGNTSAFNAALRRQNDDDLQARTAVEEAEYRRIDAEKKILAVREEAAQNRREDLAELEKESAKILENRKRLKEALREPYIAMREEIARSIGESIGHFSTLEGFLTGWKGRISHIVESLVSEIISSWARVQFLGGKQAGLEGANGKNSTLGHLLVQLGVGAKAHKAANNTDSSIAPGEDYGWGSPGGGGTSKGPSGLDTALGIASMIPGAGLWAGGALALKKFFKFADGGLLGAGIPAMVGDSHQAANGEWVIPRVPSLAIPASMLDQIAGRAVQQMGGGGGEMVNHFHIQASLSGQADIESLSEQIAWHIDQRRKVS